MQRMKIRLGKEQWMRRRSTRCWLIGVIRRLVELLATIVGFWYDLYRSKLDRNDERMSNVER